VTIGTSTYSVGVIPKSSQLLTFSVRVAASSDQGSTAIDSVGTTGSDAYLIGSTSVKILGEVSSILDGALDGADSFPADIQLNATVAAVGATAGTGQVGVTYTYVNANKVQDATAV
jgi:hypothetical protein